MVEFKTGVLIAEEEESKDHIGKADDDQSRSDRSTELIADSCIRHYCEKRNSGRGRKLGNRWRYCRGSAGTNLTSYGELDTNERWLLCGC